MIQVRVDIQNVRTFTDPAVWDRADAEIIERGLAIFKPIAVQEAPSRTGRGRAMITATNFYRNRTQGGRVGVVSPGKAFWLRILSTGATWREDIVPFRYAMNRRASQRSARRAREALGPASTRGNFRALRFRIGGMWLFRSRVVHPDLKPNEWMERSARKGEPSFVQAAEQVLERALGGRNA